MQKRRSLGDDKSRAGVVAYLDQLAQRVCRQRSQPRQQEFVFRRPAADQ
jgi:hypothetical protein